MSELHKTDYPNLQERYNKLVLQRFVISVVLMETIENLDSLFDNIMLPIGQVPRVAVLRKFCLESSAYRELVDMFNECFITREQFNYMCYLLPKSLVKNESKEVYRHLTMVMRIVF